ncbi:type IV toxin-antitoxin system AbiEi family antitoxin domain-containing protein [Streptomyces longwoodensis]|uniref:type IV toxin-antitoxin system AbiEi family antitoxin domain-containing protein n=1 Tax=Streptomyces longwoodensis TaxID=68231 RepID=UPI0033B2D98C
MDRTEQVAALSGAAADQWGLVTSVQAEELGVNRVQLMRLTEAGLLAKVGRGVYQLAAAGVTPYLEVKVAWLRLQPKRFVWDRTVGDPDSGIVSHASACQLLNLGDIPAPEVEISVPRRRTTTDSFVRLRTAQIAPTEITTVDGLPVTTAVRTITDLLNAGADGGHVGGVIADAERRDLVTIDDLAERAQPFVRKYGLKVSATGHDLINHLVAQAGERLRRQEFDRASQEGFDQAVHLLAERPELADLVWAARAAARQKAPTASVLDPVLMESIRKVMQPEPAWTEVMQRMLQPFAESLRKVSQPDPEILQRIMLPLLESVRRSQPDPEVLQRVMLPLTESVKKTSPNPEALQKIMLPLVESLRMRPDLGIRQAAWGAAAPPPGAPKAPGQETAPVPAAEHPTPPSRPPHAKDGMISGDGSQEQPEPPDNQPG